MTDKDSEFYVPPKNYKMFVAKGVLKCKRENPLYKRAKTIFVYKGYESKNTYRLRGTNRRTRNYSIGILTDDNRYYYNEYTTKHTVLSMLTASNMSRIFIDGYIIDGNTTIIVDKSIQRMNEPVYIFLTIIARSIGISVMRRDVMQMLNTINNMLGNIVHKKKDKKISMHYKNDLIEGLLKNGMLNFIPKEHISIITDMSQKLSKRNLVFFAAMGTLYAFIVGKRNKKYNI